MGLKDYDVRKLPEGTVAMKTDELQSLMEKCLETAQKACHSACPGMTKEIRERLAAELASKAFSYYLHCGADPKTIDYSCMTAKAPEEKK